jgi:hypothetical protein
MRARLFRTSIALVASLGLVGLAAAAHATPITYSFTGGSAHVTATLASDPSTNVADATIALTGTQVTFDAVAKQLTSFMFTAGPTGSIPLSGSLAGVSVVLNSVSVVPDTGYTNFIVTGPASPPGTYNYTVGPVKVSGQATFTPGGVVNFTQSNPTLSGQVQIGASNTLSLNGITLGVFSTAKGNLTVKADINFTGTPEPGTALLVGVGLVGMVAASRRRFEA